MKYNYSTVSNFGIGGKIIKRPMIEVELFNGEKSVRGFGLIDSGADSTLMNIEYAHVIGVDLSTAVKENFTGIDGSPISCHVTQIEIKVQHIEKKIKLKVGFIESKSVDILLGQAGFFDKNRIKFEKDHSTFEVVPVKKK